MMILDSSGKFAPKTTTLNLLEPKTRIIENKKLASQTSSSSKNNVPLTEKKYKTKFVANHPRVATKNTSLISKNSSFSDKRYESTKVDEKDSCRKFLLGLFEVNCES